MINNRTQPSLSRDFALLSLFIVFILILVCVWVTFETYGNYQKDVVKQMESEALRLDRGLIVEIENASYILESVGRLKAERLKPIHEDLGGTVGYEQIRLTLWHRAAFPVSQ